MNEVQIVRHQTRRLHRSKSPVVVAFQHRLLLNWQVSDLARWYCQMK